MDVRAPRRTERVRDAAAGREVNARLRGDDVGFELRLGLEELLRLVVDGVGLALQRVKLALLRSDYRLDHDVLPLLQRPHHLAAASAHLRLQLGACELERVCGVLHLAHAAAQQMQPQPHRLEAVLGIRTLAGRISRRRRRRRRLPPRGAVCRVAARA